MLHFHSLILLPLSGSRVLQDLSGCWGQKLEESWEHGSPHGGTPTADLGAPVLKGYMSEKQTFH